MFQRLKDLYFISDVVPFLKFFKQFILTWNHGFTAKHFQLDSFPMHVLC